MLAASRAAPCGCSVSRSRPLFFRCCWCSGPGVGPTAGNDGHPAGLTCFDDKGRWLQKCGSDRLSCCSALPLLIRQRTLRHGSHRRASVLKHIRLIRTADQPPVHARPAFSTNSHAQQTDRKKKKFFLKPGGGFSPPEAFFILASADCLHGFKQGGPRFCSALEKLQLRTGLTSVNTVDHGTPLTTRNFPRRGIWRAQPSGDRSGRSCHSVCRTLQD